MEHSEIVLICVPTPLRDQAPDLSHVEEASRDVARHLSRARLVVLESTTYPGTTDHLVRPILETSGLSAERDFLLAYSPERIDPGNEEFGFRTTPRIVGGTSPEATGVATRLLRTARGQGRRVDVVPSGRAGEAPGEHVPSREHRPRQRDGDALPRDGHRRVGGRRGRGDQAVRVHALLPRARVWAGTASRSIRRTSRGRCGGRPATSSGSSSRRRT